MTDDSQRIDLRNWWMLAEAAHTEARFEATAGGWSMIVGDRPGAVPCGLAFDKRTAGWWRAVNVMIPEIYAALEKSLVDRDLALNALREAAPDRWLRVVQLVGSTGAAGQSDWHSALGLEVERHLITEALE